MVALWIQKPLDFSAFPTVLLVATILRLALNIATTRLILSHGERGRRRRRLHHRRLLASFVMGGDFVIGIIVFLILVTVNFLVITKGATRIAEVGARFTLDAIPGKQMAIDADLSAGLIDEKEAQRRRRELEEESAFFGSMDGASKFVRGDAIAGLIIIAVNIFGGIVIGVTRHGLTLGARGRRLHQALGRRRPGDADPGADRFACRRPPGRQGRHAGLGRQGGDRPAQRLSRALFLAALADGGARRRCRACRSCPSRSSAALMAFVGFAIPRRIEKDRRAEAAKAAAKEERAKAEARASIKEQLKSFEIELVLGKQLARPLLRSRDEIGSPRRQDAAQVRPQYGFVVPEIQLSDDLSIAPKTYQIKIHGTAVATQANCGSATISCVIGDGRKPDLPGDEVREPAFGMRAIWIPEAFAEDVKREGFKPVDNLSVLLTHLSEVIHNNLAQLLSYKDMRALLDRLEPEYKRLVDDICPSQISYSACWRC